MMKGISSYLFLVFYLILYQAYTQLIPLEGKWMIGNFNLGTSGDVMQSFQTESTGSELLGKIFTVKTYKDPSGQVHTESRVEEFSKGGVSVDQGFLDPVKAVNRAMTKTVGSNILSTRNKQMIPQSSVFDPMQSVQTAMSETISNMDSMMNNRRLPSESRVFGQRQPIQHTFSQTSFNVDRRIPNQESLLNNGYFGKTNKVFTQPDITSVGNGIRTETSHGSQSAISTFDPQFHSLRRGGSFRSPVGPVRKLQTSAAFTPSPRGSGAFSTFHPQFPRSKEGSSVFSTFNPGVTRTKEIHTTPSPLVKLVAKKVTETQNGSGTNVPKPMCIYIDDPIYNTLCLMKTEGIATKNVLDGVTHRPRKNETIKETFKGAADLVSFIAKGMCAFCCHAQLRDQEKCFKRFCENKTSC
ncbi:uncharacterized protein LOC133173096 isoform X3 [Saccostrea echinata]|uniref:uncharacterized protein LOC133173096 isoform X3 n=1 Tax=Saccostrea echinata TaxID=191078 RepID=UPI002A83CCA8|nr:uncharacterized protein LOC133173096 isoform X3 [Saccostrea echinata]